MANPVENEAKESLIQQICRGLSRYYRSYGWQYDNLFSTYCEDNSIEEDGLDEELNSDAKDAIIIGFAESDSTNEYDFPFPKQQVEDKAAYILDIIQKCYNNKDITFDVNLPICMYTLWEIYLTYFRSNKHQHI